jgi:hypothetical protein
MNAPGLLLLAAVGVEPARIEHMPEPLVHESLTDIDGIEAGEIEVDTTGSAARHAWSSTIEIEWRALARLGLAVEAGAADAGSGTAGEVRFGASVPIIHDFPHDLHLMIEGGARFPEDAGEAEPGDTALPYFVGVRGGWRHGGLTLRAGADFEAGGRGARVPLGGSGAALVSFGPEARGFFGLEVGVDAARAAPLVIVPEAAYLFGSRVPIRVGLAAPVVIDPDTSDTRLSALVRLVLELGE